MKTESSKVSLTKRARVLNARKVTLVGLVINVILTALKFFAGIAGSSAAMVADAIHSLSDFATDLVVLFGFHIIQKPADKTHKYGHGKVETLATVIIGVALFAVGLNILWGGDMTIIKTLRGRPLNPPGLIALYAAIISIITKEWLYQYTVRTGRKINSQAVIANAWHHRSDAFSSIGTMLGIGGAILLGDKWRILDPIAAVVVSFFIIHIAILISKTGLNELLEASVSETTEKEIMGVILSIPGIIDAHGMKSRRIGSAIAVDIHVEVDNSLTVTSAHDIATAVEGNIMNLFGEDTIINVHVEPSPQTDKNHL